MNKNVSINGPRIKRIITLIFVALNTLAYGQKLSIEEMIDKTSCKTYECAEELIKKKGFSFSDPSGNNGSFWIGNKEIVAFSDDKTKSMKSHNAVTLEWILGGSGIEKIVISTMDKKYYSDLADQMEAKGFILESTSETDQLGKQYKKYTSKNYPKISIRIQTSKLFGDGVKWASYDIEVVNI